MVTAEQIHKEFRADLMGDVTPEETKTLSLIGYQEVTPEALKLKFPLHKIITVNKAITICNKYNLKICRLDQFVGSIPQKNIQEINTFVKQYMKYNVEYRYDSIFKKSVDKIISVDMLESAKKEEGYYTYQPNLSFYICAPDELIVSDEKRSSVIKMSPDPVILAEWIGYVEGDKNYQSGFRSYRIIVTAWGIEASDPSVVNHNNN